MTRSPHTPRVIVTEFGVKPPCPDIVEKTPAAPVFITKPGAARSGAIVRAVAGFGALAGLIG